MKKTIMKKSLLALCALAAMPTLSFAQSITVGSASGPAGGAAAPLPIAIVFAQNAAPTAANTVRDIDVRLTYNPALLTITAVGAAPGTCLINIPGTIIVGVPDNGATPIVGGTICNLTAVNIAAAAPIGPITLTIAKGAGSGCSNAMGATANCVYNNGTVTVVGGSVAPTLNPLTTPVTLTGGVGSVPVSVATAGTAGGSLGLACTIPPTGASAFAITTGANRTITGPAALGANAPAIGLSCVPGVAAVSATLSCARTPTPAAALPALTSEVTCPQGGPTITPNLLGGTAATPSTLTIANTSVPPQPVGTVINITGLTVTGAGFVAPNTGSWGACIYSADAAPPAGTTSDPTAFTAGPQLVFNATNNTVAQPQVIGATRRAGQVSAIATCPVLPVGTAPAATANVYRLVLAAGAPVAAGTITAVTAPGAVTLPGYTLPIGSSSTVLNFNITGANGSLACVPTGAGYTAAPNPRDLVVGTAGGVTVTYTGNTAGTFVGTLTCTAVAPSTGGPFVYTLSTTVTGVVLADTIAVPTLGNISLMLLIAGFLGMGMVLVGRRQA